MGVSAKCVAVPVIAGTMLATIVTAQSAGLQTQGAAPLQTGVDAQRTLVRQYCVTCHNPRTRAGGLTLDTIDFASVSDHGEVLEKVVRKLRAGLMPPAGLPRPDKSALDGLAAWLERELDRAAMVHPNPGRKETFHRLNRAEYRNAIRDLLSLDIDVSALLPPEDASFGFDNLAGGLKIGQSQLEQYLAAARKISRLAVAGLAAPTGVDEFRVPESLNQYEHVEGLPFGTRGGLLIRHTFSREGEYEIAVDLRCRISGECDGGTGYGDTHVMEVLVDGEPARTFTLEPLRNYRPPEDRTWRVRVPVKGGPHEVGVTFRKVPSIEEVDSIIHRFDRPYFTNGSTSGANHHNAVYQPFVDRVTLTGPVGQSGGPGDTPSRRRIFTCRPARSADEARCARQIVGTLARRAYRRPVVPEDLRPLMDLYDTGRAEGGFEVGIETALRRLLVSPEFLYRVESDPPNAVSGTNYRVTDLELASRLSFFLWSSIPDDELLELATKGRLKDGAVLERQVRRMIADRRADALISNFAGQWLLLRNLEAATPDDLSFPNFDDSLRQALQRETELFIASVLREDRSVMELLTADYTFINERLARHYGIRGVYGTRFRRITLADENRRGLLGHGSVLTVTSRPNRTSPVLRGKWILDAILGTPPPEPPANVPALEEMGDGNHEQIGSVRERMAAHRKNPTCSGCHSMIDPPGFALENFDGVGQWRERDETGRLVDASGVLPDGTKFDGLIAFRRALVSDSQRFATALTEKLLTYAVGRGLEYYDRPAVRQIVRDATPGGLKLSALIVGITRSLPFQMRRAGAPQIAARR